MMRLIVRSSLRYRYLVLAAAATMMAIGLFRLQNVPVDVFPEFAPPRVEIQTIAVGMSTTEVEELITVPLEQALAGVEGLDILRSKSVEQLSSILLIFKPGTDLLHARQLVAERVQAVTPSLPTWAAPPFMLQPLSATSRVMKIGVSSDTVDLFELSKTAYWNIRSRLLSVEGVANIAIWGERLNQFQVQVKPDQMAQYGIALDDVMEATARALDAPILMFSEGHTIGTGGYVETANQRLIVQHVPSVVAPSALDNVTLTSKDGKEVRLPQIADIVLDHQPLFGDAVINDGPGIMLIVEKFPWANTLDVTRGVEAAIDEMRPGLKDVAIDTTIFRPATFIDVALENLSRALLLGSVLVFAILLLFLFDWRTALISLVAIPLSLVAAALVLQSQGTTINTMVLAGLVISVGVVVDDAIIDIENIVRRLRQNRLEGTGRSTASIVLEASLEVRSAIIYATFINVVALIPVFLIEGLSGAFFRPLAVSYALAMLASLVVALTVTPAMAFLLLRRSRVERRSSPVALILQERYQAALGRIIGSARPAFALVGGISVVGVLVGSQLGQSLLPDFKERDFLMHWVTAPGTSHGEEVRISTAACVELRSIPGVRNCGSHIGQAMLADEVVGIDFGENWISVDPSVDYDKTHAAIQSVVDGYPGLRRDVQTYLKERIREVLTGSSDAIVVRIFGPNLDVLDEKAKELEEAMKAIPGTKDVHRQLQTQIPQVQIEVDLAKAQAYGIKPGDVRRAASVLLSSEEVGDVFFGGAAYDVHVWTTPDVRQNLTDIEQLLIDTPGRGKVPLGELASVKVAPAPNSVTHENLTRRIDVDANVTGRDLGSVVRDVQAAVDKIQFDEGYHPEMLGEFAERQAATDRLMLFALAALFGIFLLLQASFNNTRLAILAFLTLPSALVGGILAAWATGGVLSLGSIVGFFTVLGIAARNGIMMINHFQHLERFEGEPFGPGLVLRGARERLSPILMTALATGLALIPLAIAGDLPGHEIEHPMAIVILGGLVTSTLLNLLITPSLYLRFGRGSDPETPAPVPATAG